MTRKASLSSVSFFVIFLTALVISSCSTMSGTVQERASYDFKCGEDSIDVVSIGGNSYAAKGCGKEMTYTCVGRGTDTKSCWPDGGGRLAHPVVDDQSPPPAAMMAPPPAPMTPPAAMMAPPPMMH